MVINRKEIKRKRKANNISCNLIDDTPKRTKVQAQRKFAQGSNVSSPVITPVKEIEKQEKQRVDVIPEPQELLPMNRPHTEDFLTFLCFRGTSMLPPNLNFFNTAPVDSRIHIQPLQKEPITVIPPIANISTRSTAGTSERPFIAFGVRKRADPILVSKHMDKKRRHALALQALRRKYQEQKMAKIRAVTISKLSEKVTSKSVVRTRSITKNETNTVKKTIPQKTRVKIISTKHVKVTTRSSIKTPLRTAFTTPIRSTIQKKMCLRSFRGRFIQRELTIKKSKKKNTTRIIKKVKTKQTREISSEFSSDDDQPLKSFKVNKASKLAKKRVSAVKKPLEMSFRVTRAHPVLLKHNEQGFKRKLHVVRSTLNSKLPYVKLTAPKLLTNKQKTTEEKSPATDRFKTKEKILNLRTRKIETERNKKEIDTKKKSEVIEINSKTNSKETEHIVEKKVKKIIKEDDVVPERVTRTSKVLIKTPLRVIPKRNNTANTKDAKKPENVKNNTKKDDVPEEKKKPDHGAKMKKKNENVDSADAKQSKEEQIPTEKHPKPKENKEKSDKSDIETIKTSDQPRVILKKDNTIIANEKELRKPEGKPTKNTKEVAVIHEKKEESTSAPKVPAETVIQEKKEEIIKPDDPPVEQISKQNPTPVKDIKQQEVENPVKEIKQLETGKDLKKSNVKQPEINNLKDEGKKKIEAVPEDAKDTKKKLENLEVKEAKKKIDGSDALKQKETKKKLENVEVKEPKKKIEVSDALKQKETKKKPENVEVKESKVKIQGSDALKQKETKKKVENVIVKEPKKKIESNDTSKQKETKKKLENVEVKETKKKIEANDALKQKETKKKEHVEVKEAKNKIEASDVLKQKEEKDINPKCEIDNNVLKNKPEPVVKDVKGKNEKTEVKCVKKKLASFEEPRLSQRPTRKTKEAAAIYMEILGHKLVNECDMDDDNISIDSFPELPNVRKTEQRENELKAKAKSKNVDQEVDATVKPTEEEVKSKIRKSKPEIEIPKNNETKTKNEPEKNTEPAKNKENSDSDTSTKRTKRVTSADNPQPTSRITRGSAILKNPINELSDSDESLPDNHNKNPTERLKKGDSIPKPKTKKQKLETNKSTLKTKTKKNTDSESDESTSKISNTGKLAQKVENSFSDSDEEPLSKLTRVKSKNEAKSPDTKTKKENENTALILSGKPKRECTKRPQNYLPLFSSSEDEEKYFYGFIKTEAKNKSAKTQSKCVPTASADLLCKDVDKRFGKGKVNMSTEQIEQWLKDSALAGSAIKKDTDMYKFEEKLRNSTDFVYENTDDLLKDKEEKCDDSEKLKISSDVSPSPVKNTDKAEDSSKTKDVDPLDLQTNQKLVERKTIFRKERKIPIPKVNAFSANNESSVYAFEADSEDIINTPFRRPSRRPSSTGTSRSEDSSKFDESSKSKFRYPPILKQDMVKSGNKQEVSVMLSTDESNNTPSIAVQLDLNSAEVVVNSENSATDREDGEQLFYIPLQPGKQSSSQVIQGVAVKLGTKGANGPNQRVVMSAKLVTHSPVGVQKGAEKSSTCTSMYPPTSTLQKPKSAEGKSYLKGGVSSKASDHSEEIKYKIPSSPSASSSSSTKVTKRQCVKTRIRPLELCNPIVSKDFPSGDRSPVIVEAPTFYPNDKEFQDPLEYIHKIRQHAEQFGICRIVPPTTFKPECKVADDMRFTAYNQYVHKMLHRWGPNFKEFMAITKYLETQNITLTHPPWIGGMEIDLPRLYQVVQSLGGLKEVIEKKKWPKVSESMKIPKSAQDRVTKLDDIYCKYLLPYDTLSIAEREKLFDEVETEWAKRESKALLKSQQKINNRDNSSTSSDVDSNDESDECIVKGRSMALNAFYRIARNTMSMWFKTIEPSAQEVEQEFWKHVTMKQNHICVHSGSIDSGSWGYGFAVSKNSPFARHAWNLKVLTNNSASILRSMGPVMGVTVPTLHVGMVFSACCWYRDPHSLPWTEYLHTGGNKIWYGIPDSMSETFRAALIKLVPNYCRNKSLWLPSDTAMVPPSLLVEHGLSLCRVIQEPGQFIVVFPKAFTSSLSTGYVVSESVYFAPLNWLNNAQAVFNELQQNCEPSMFSLDKLIISIANDARSSVDVLKLIVPIIRTLCDKEKFNIEKLVQLGLTDKERFPLPEVPLKKKKKLQNDSGDYECEVCCKNLFISWVIYSQEDGVYCLDHAIENIQKTQIEGGNCKLFYTYNESELLNLIEKVKSTIEVKLQKRAAGKNV